MGPNGQLWGNPLYDWPAMQRRRYRWWTERLRRTFALFDVTRIDHFRGFVAYWAVPEGAPDARGGRWRRGPGRALFDAAAAQLGELPVIAEDLGVITEPVDRLRRSLGFPGMVVMQFGFDPDDPNGPHRLENHEELSVVYTGTHDTDTLRGWWESLPDVRRAAAVAEIAEAGLCDDEPWWSVIRLAYSSPARLAMLQAQDILGLGSEARMNVPGRATGSWRWQMAPGALTSEHAKRLRAAVEEAGRV
jgi:4-alpha-glucanotransferase